MTDLDDIRGRLEGIAEELADAAMDRLRLALEAGASGPPSEERRITRARRAVERAVAILSGPDGGGGAEPDG